MPLAGSSERNEIPERKVISSPDQKERKFRYAHQMRDADISRMRKRLCETIIQVTAGIFFMRYADRATVTLREDAKSSTRSEKKMLVDWMQVCMDC